MAGAGASLATGLHFSQTLAALAALTQQGWPQGLPPFSALSQQLPVLNLALSTAGAASVVAAIASEVQTATRARRRRKFFVVTFSMKPFRSHQADLAYLALNKPMTAPTPTNAGTESFCW